MFLTKKQLEEISRQIATISVKDTDFDETHKIRQGDSVAIVQDGKNKKIDIGELGGYFATIDERLIPDNEDISVREDTNVLSFADRSHAEGNGMGYVILRKNKTFAEQVVYENTIYEIRYDFDLGETAVTIPAGCVLKFNGGSLSNGSIIGSQTVIDAGPTRIFNSIAISGSWDTPAAYVEWFGAKGDGITDDTEAIQLSADSFDHIVLLSKVYVSDRLTVTRDGFTLEGTEGSTLFAVPHESLYSFIVVRSKKNCLLSGFTITSENAFDVDPGGMGITSIEKTSNRTAISFSGIDGIEIRDIKISNCFQAVASNETVGQSYNARISNLVVGEKVLFPMLITYLENFILENSTIRISDTADVLYHHIYAHSDCINHIIRNCIFTGNGGNYPIHYRAGLADDIAVDRLVVENCVFLNTCRVAYVEQALNTSVSEIILKNCYAESDLTKGTSEDVINGAGSYHYTIKDCIFKMPGHRLYLGNMDISDCVFSVLNSQVARDSDYLCNVNNCDITFNTTSSMEFQYNTYIPINVCGSCIKSRRTELWVFQFTYDYGSLTNDWTYRDCIFETLNSVTGFFQVSHNYTDPISIIGCRAKNMQRIVNSAQKVALYADNTIESTLIYGHSANTGPTDNRPNSYVATVGLQYYDTDLNQPIWVKAVGSSSVTWVDATGTEV